MKYEITIPKKDMVVKTDMDYIGIITCTDNLYDVQVNFMNGTIKSYNLDKNSAKYEPLFLVPDYQLTQINSDK